MADVKVRARKLIFHGGTRVYPGEVFTVTEAQLAETRTRYKDRKIDPPYELVPAAKPAPKAEPPKLDQAPGATDTSDIA